MIPINFIFLFTFFLSGYNDSYFCYKLQPVAWHFEGVNSKWRRISSLGGMNLRRCLFSKVNSSTETFLSVRDIHLMYSMYVLN